MGAAAIIGGVAAASVGIGIAGSVMANDAQSEATQAQRDIAATQLDYQKQLMAPYQSAGAQGLSKLYGQDVTYTDPKTGLPVTVKGSGTPYDIFTDPVTGQKISYDAMVTKQLGADAYTQSPEYQAQNALAQKALSNQRQARGLEFSAPASAAAQSAELSQKLTAQDYGQYKADLINRYNTLRNQASSQYDVLTQQANLGLGATKQLGAAGQNYATAASAAAANQGAADAQFWSGLGNIASSGSQAATGAFNLGSSLGWF